MALHVAFLRAINVGGRRVTNADLIRIASDAGLGDVQAYQAAGNLIVDPGTRTAPEVGELLQTAIAKALGYTAEVFVRTPDEIDAVLAFHPFADALPTEPKAKHQIAFLLDVPSEEGLTAVADHQSATDLLAVEERELHWLPLAGVGRAALDMNALAAALGPMTVRTRATVERIHARFLTG